MNKRNCPKCNKEITYKSKYGLFGAIKRNSLCIRCSQIKYEEDKKCIDCGRKILRVSIRCKSCSKKGKLNWVTRNGGLKPETIDKLRKICGGKNHSNYKKRLSETTKQKISNSHKKENLSYQNIINYRIGAMNRILRQKNQKNNTYGNYNEIACKFFDKLNKFKNWNGIHALNGGEYAIKNLGYFLDYYEPDKNIAIEWDEPYHRKKKQTEKDERKEKEIKALLNCKFYRIKQYEMDFDLLQKLKNNQEYEIGNIINI
jgi:hypothetical protein